MAGENVYVLRYAKHPSSAIAGATHAKLTPGTASKANQGAAGTTGRKGTLVTDKRIDAEVFALDVIYTLTGVVHGVTTLTYPVFARLVPRTTVKTNQGAAGSPGPAGAVVTHRELGVEVYGLSYAEILGLLEDAAATLTLSILGEAGAAQSIAITNVYFDRIVNPVEFPAKDEGGKLAAWGVGGECHFGDAETFADVITATPTNYTAMLAKIGATAANLVLGTYGAAGAAEKHTIKNVYFHSPIGNIEIPAKDVAGKLSTFGIRGQAIWGANDTFALMLTAGSDS